PIMTRSKWVAALSSLWVLAISYRYVNTIVRGFRSPFDHGNDIEWFAIWVALAIVMTLLAATIKRAVEVVFLILIAACGLVFILSGTIGPAITVCGILFLAFLVGRRLLLVFGVEPILVLAVPVGLVLLALCGFALAALHILTPLSIGVVFLGSTFLSAYNIRAGNGVFE